MIPQKLDRRSFLQLGTATLTSLTLKADPQTKPKLPRWRGFNLLEKFTREANSPYKEQDFEWMATWGFDFARLPMSYTCWSTPDHWRTLNDQVLKEIDQAVEYGRQHNIHINLNFHRAPGYCVNPPKEPLNLWTDEEALEAAGVGIHVGECGCYNQTPHPVALAWLKDFLELWQDAGWGFAIWNFRGSFGILDSDRKDVKYETFNNHKLDRKLLELLQNH